MPLLITTADAARLTGAHVNTIRLWLGQGLPAVLIGGHRLINPHDLDQFLADRAADGKPFRPYRPRRDRGRARSSAVTTSAVQSASR